MRFKSGKSWRKGCSDPWAWLRGFPASVLRSLGAGAIFFALASLASQSSFATLTVTPANGGSAANNIVYYAIKPVTSGFVDKGDPSYPFTDINLGGAQKADGSLPDGILLFNVSSNATTFKTDAGQTLVLVVSTNGSSGTKKFMPIASYNLSPDQNNSQTPCSSGPCLPGEGIPLNDIKYFQAVKFTTGQKIQIGMYVSDICRFYTDAPPTGLGSANGCSGTSTVVETLVQKLQLQFAILALPNTVTDLNNASPAISTDGQENASLTLSFETKGPDFTSCPTTTDESLYEPGDGQIFLNTTNFGAETSAQGGAPVSTVIVVANDGVAAAVDNTFYAEGKNAIVQRVARGISGQVIPGFVNAESAGEHKYQLGFLIRDAAGVVKDKLTDGVTTCTRDGVQAVEIQGFIRKGNCFIATAAFRSLHAKPVGLLREFRREILLKFPWGRQLVHQYNLYSPGLAEWLMEHPAFRHPVLLALAPIEIFAWFLLNPGVLGGFLGLYLTLVLFLLQRRMKT